MSGGSAHSVGQGAVPTHLAVPRIRLTCDNVTSVNYLREYRLGNLKYDVLPTGVAVGSRGLPHGLRTCGLIAVVGGSCRGGRSVSSRGGNGSSSSGNGNRNVSCQICAADLMMIHRALRLDRTPRLARIASLLHAMRAAAVQVGAARAHMVRMAAHGARAAPARRLRVARQAAGPRVGTARADHARLRAREQRVAADTRVVAAEALLLALRLALRQARVGGERACMRVQIDAPIVSIVVVAVVQHAAARRVVQGDHCVGGQVLTVRPPNRRGGCHARGHVVNRLATFALIAGA